MRVSLAGVVKSYGAQPVLDRVDLTLGPHSRLGVVGPQRAPASRRCFACSPGSRSRTRGASSAAPATLTAGYLPQEHDRRPGETLLAYLARRTGVAAAEADVAAAHRASWEPDALRGRARALPRARRRRPRAPARTVCAELGLPVSLEQETDDALGRRGGPCGARRDPALALRPAPARRADERPRLRRARAARALPRRLPRAASPSSRTTAPSSTGRSTASPRSTRGRAAVARVRRRLERVRARRASSRARASTALRALAGAPPRGRGAADERRSQARAAGGFLAKATGGAGPPRHARASMTKVRQAEKALERVEQVDKPYEPWRAAARRFGVAQRPATASLTLEGAVARARQRSGSARSTSTSLPASASPSRARTAAASRRCSRSCSASCRSTAGSAHGRPRDSDRRARPAPDAPTTATSRCSTTFVASAPASPRRTRARCSRSSASAPTTSMRACTIALAGRADARPPRRAAGARRQLPRARRADEPPRPRGDRGARVGARRLRGNGRRRLARPALPRARRADPGDLAPISAILRAAHGSPQEENLQGSPRQAPRAARHRGAARERVPDLPSAEAAAPRLPDLQDVQGPRDRAAPHAAP